MNPINLTREDIEQLNDVEPYCFETDREEQWFNIGLQYGLDVADSDPISPWISVDEDLPCNHDELINTEYDKETVYVVVIGKDVIADTDCMEYNGKEWVWQKNSFFEPTHWFPIPKLPK